MSLLDKVYGKVCDLLNAHRRSATYINIACAHHTLLRRLLSTANALHLGRANEDMANTKVFALFFAVLLATGQIANGSVGNVLVVVNGAITTVTVSYIAYRAYAWMRDFADFLLEYPSLSDIPDWFVKNPPTFVWDAFLYTGISEWLMKWMSSKRVEVMKEYSQEEPPCGSNTVCGKVFGYMADIWGSDKDKE